MSQDQFRRWLLLAKHRKPLKSQTTYTAGWPTLIGVGDKFITISGCV